MSKKKTALVLFSILTIIGILVFDDYGISMDEEYQRLHGIVTYRWLNRKIFNRGVFVNEGTEDLMTYGGRKYGVALQLPMVFIEDVYNVVHGNPMSFRSVYLMRHAWLHAYFLIGLYCFYCMLCDLYNKPMLAAAGVLMIYVFGRIFADSFYNVKDLLFVSVSFVELYFAERVLRSGRSTKWCLLFALSTAFLVSSRVVGAIYPALLIVIMLGEDIQYKRKFELRPYLLVCGSVLIWFVITPAAWSNPLNYAFGYAKKFSNYTEKSPVLFGGNYYEERKLPVDYCLRWIGITVPFIFLLFSFFGSFFFFRRIIKRSPDSYDSVQTTEMLLMAFGIFTITILYQMIKHPTIYNGWRHVYYLYPPIVMMAVHGVDSLIQYSSVRWVKAAVIAILGLSISYNAVLNIINHPFEFGSYNPIGQQIGKNYERDYWEAGVYHVMDWIAQTADEIVSVGDIDVTRRDMKASYSFLRDDRQAKIIIPTDDTDYIIFRNFSEKSDSAIVDGYQMVREFYAYHIKLYTVYQKQ